MGHWDVNAAGPGSLKVTVNVRAIPDQAHLLYCPQEGDGDIPHTLLDIH